MSGYKFKLLVIDNAKNPRALARMDKTTLPVHYRHSRNAWMTADIFREWFIDHLIPESRQFFGEVPLQFLLDNCSAHPKDLDDMSPHIFVKFLPANTTSLIQPMDQAVIYFLKSHQKKKFYQKLFEYCENNPDDLDPFKSWLKTYTIKEAMYDLHDAWEAVPTSTLQKSFNKVFDKDKYLGFTQETITEFDFEGFNEEEILDREFEANLQEIQTTLSQIRLKGS